jgi:hypothetical protein
MESFIDKGQRYVVPSIPPPTESHAREVCNIPDSEEVVALIDCSFTRRWSGRECFVFGASAIYFRFLFGPKGALAYDTLHQYTFEVDPEGGNVIRISPGSKTISLAGSDVPEDQLLKVLLYIQEYLRTGKVEDDGGGTRLR